MKKSFSKQHSIFTLKGKQKTVHTSLININTWTINKLQADKYFFRGKQSFAEKQLLPEKVIFSGWVKMLIGATVGQPSAEVVVPTADTVASRQVQFRVSEMRLTTPEEMFRKLVGSFCIFIVYFVGLLLKYEDVIRGRR